MTGFPKAIEQLRSTAEPTRFRILRLLQRNEFNLTDLTHVLGQSQPRVSRHVKLLADAGLIERHQEGSFVFVRSTSDAKIRALIESAIAIVDQTDPQLHRDTERAATIQAARMSQAQSYFDRHAPEWDRIRALHVSEREVEETMLAMLSGPPFELLLEVGTGTGRILELFSHRAKRLIGVDTNREMLKCARVRLEGQKLRNCSVRLGDVYNLPFADGSADAIIVHQVLHFLTSGGAALAEASRVLKPGGQLLVVDFAPHTHEFLREDYAHLRLGFNSAEVERWLFKAGLRQAARRELHPENESENPLTVAMWLSVKAGAAESTLSPTAKAAE